MSTPTPVLIHEKLDAAVTIARLAQNAAKKADLQSWEHITDSKPRPASEIVIDAVNALRLCLNFLERLNDAPWPSSITSKDAENAFDQLDTTIAEITDELRGILNHFTSNSLSNGSLSGNSVYRSLKYLPIETGNITTYLSIILDLYKRINDDPTLTRGQETAVDELVTTWSQRLDERAFAEDARKVRDQTVEVLEATKQAAGETSSTVLGEHFGEYHKEEKGQANFFPGLSSNFIDFNRSPIRSNPDLCSPTRKSTRNARKASRDDPACSTGGIL